MKSKKVCRYILAFAGAGWLVLLIAVQLGAAEGGTAVKDMSLTELKAFVNDATAPRAVLFITTNCRACKDVMSKLKTIYNRHEGAALDLMAVGVNPGGAGAISTAIQDIGAPFPVFWVGEKAIRTYRLFGVPALLLIKDGRIEGRIVGAHPESVFKEKIADFFGAHR